MLLRLSKFALLVIAIATMLGAAEDPFTGTWNLDVAKSKIHPGPAPQSQTVSIAPDGKVSFHAVAADGKTTDWSYLPSSDGTPSQITGVPDSTVTIRKLGNGTVEHVWKFGPATERGKAVLSKDGKVMTYTLRGKNSQGQAVHEVEIYEKQ
jgi:hypothetical protein